MESGPGTYSDGQGRSWATVNDLPSKGYSILQVITELVPEQRKVVFTRAFKHNSSG